MPLRSSGVLALALAVLLPGAALASHHEEVESPEPATGVALTVSPIHLLLPVVEVTAEVAILPRVSVALIGAFGEVSGIGLWEAGAHVRHYLTGDFDGGVQVGIEALMAGASAEDGDVEAVATGLAVGPFIGWKGVWGAGFTFDVQGGIQRIVVRGSASDGTSTAKASQDDWIPLLNLNLGWSF